MTDVELEVADSFERVFPVPTVVADWDDVLDRAGARSGPPRTRPPSRSRVVAIAAAIVAGAALLAAPALGLGDRLLSLIQGKRISLDVQAPAWSGDGRTIVFVSFRDGNGEIYAMDADGGQPRNLTQHPAKDVRPRWSPDGRRIVFVSYRDGQSEIYVMNADGSKKRNLTRDRALDDNPTWSRDGRRIAFFRARPAGSRFGPNCRCRVKVYDTGVYVMNADGSGLRRLTRTQRPIGGQIVWAPDGRTLYFGRYLVNVDGSGARRLPYIPLTAVWSPDGTRIVFVRTFRRSAPSIPINSQIYVMNADGSGLRRLTESRLYNFDPAWSPDGRKIAFRSTRDGNAEIYVMNADGSGEQNLTQHAAKDGRPAWSPDGRTIAFVSNRDGRLEAHVMNADGSGQRSLTSQER